MDLDKYKYFNLQISNSAVEIQINRPEKKNAFNPEMVCELCDIWEIIESNSNIKLGILRSISTEFFSAGADLKELIPLLTGDLKPKSQFESDLLKDKLLDKFYRKDKTYNKPIIGYASGYCLAGGFELLLSCDFLIVDENTKIGLPETTLGLIPAGGGISRISEALSRSLSLEILINSKNVDLKKLLYSGIINEIVNRNNVEDVIENYSKKVTDSSQKTVELLMANIDKLQKIDLKEKFNLEDRLLNELLDE
jgi:enoyl-CoA hydratase|tara:strand:+ start:209 stop:964 length:756 start_codon:yes stop_codon:yes gene_type:complete